MKNIKAVVLIFSLFLSLVFAQKADLLTQQVNVENAIRAKVEKTVNKFLDEAQYLIIVNARLEFKPLSTGSLKESGFNKEEQSTYPYTLIPGLEMPSIPTKQTIYQPTIREGSFEYSTEKYFLYGLEITIYVDEKTSTGSLQQNIKTLIAKNMPEISDCDDCIKFETINFLAKGKSSNRYDELLEKIELLEEERRTAEENLQNWRFEQLEDQLASSEDARSEWEQQARDKENIRRLDDSSRMASLQKIDKQYRAKQDSLYILTSIKLDEALRGRIKSEENTKKELLGLIKMQIQGEGVGNQPISDETRSDLYTKRPTSLNSGISTQMVLIIIVIILLLSILFFMIIKNKKTVYLKPKNNIENRSSEKVTFSKTSAHENDEVQKSELQSLRQSAVSMSVSEKAGANQIVQDWLGDGTAEEDENEEQKNKE